MYGSSEVPVPLEIVVDDVSAITGRKPLDAEIISVLSLPLANSQTSPSLELVTPNDLP